jgi:hypothetical protein
MNNIKEDKNKMTPLFTIHKNKDFYKEGLGLSLLWKGETNINLVHLFVRKNISYAKN